MDSHWIDRLAERAGSPVPLARREVLRLLMAGVAGAGLGCRDSAFAPAKESKPKPSKIRLILTHSLSPEHPTSQGIVRFREEIASRSQGEVELRIFGRSGLGDEVNLIEQFSSGRIDMINMSATTLAARAEPVDVYTLPYLFRDKLHMHRALDGAVGRELLDAAMGGGMKGLCYFDAGIRSLFTKDRMIESPADLRGLTIRTPASPKLQRLMALYGATPRVTKFTEAFEVLKDPAVAGAENNPATYCTEKYFEKARFFCENEHAAIPDVLLINRGRFEGLCERHREVLCEAASEASLYQRRIWQNVEDGLCAQMAAAGVEFHRPEKGPFIELAKPIHDEAARDPRIKTLIERIRAVAS